MNTYKPHRIPLYHRFAGILLALIMFLLATPAMAQENPPPPPPDGGGGPQEWVLVACVIVAAATIVIIGGCAAKKLMKQKPRTFGDDDDVDPPPPPPATNAPPALTNAPPGFTNTVPKKKLAAAIQVPASATVTGDTPTGMVAWDITDTAPYRDNTNTFVNTATGSRFNLIFTASIQGSSDGANWSVVGSRIIWYSSQDNTAIINYYNGAGEVQVTRYIPRNEMGEAPVDSDAKVQLEPWEVGDEPMKFYRLASPVDRIGVLTN